MNGHNREEKLSRLDYIRSEIMLFINTVAWLAGIKKLDYNPDQYDCEKALVYEEESSDDHDEDWETIAEWDVDSDRRLDFEGENL